jgi:hypothetical protein
VIFFWRGVAATEGGGIKIGHGFLHGFGPFVSLNWKPKKGQNIPNWLFGCFFHVLRPFNYSLSARKPSRRSIFR